jgi:hypothetical protein
MRTVLTMVVVLGGGSMAYAQDGGSRRTEQRLRELSERVERLGREIESLRGELGGRSAKKYRDMEEESFESRCPHCGRGDGNRFEFRNFDFDTDEDDLEFRAPRGGNRRYEFDSDEGDFEYSVPRGGKRGFDFEEFDEESLQDMLKDLRRSGGDFQYRIIPAPKRGRRDW